MDPEQYFLPALLPWTRELGRSEETIVALSGVQVWPDSCTLSLMVFRQRSRHDEHLGMPFGFGHPMNPAGPGGSHFGVLYADGRRVTSLGRQLPWPPDTDRGPAADPVLTQRGGNGGEFHYRVDLQLWPLPPDGPLTLVVQWLDCGIPETRTEIDGSAIRAAATEAVEIWPDLPPRPADVEPESSGMFRLHATGSTQPGGVEPAEESGPEHLGNEEG